MIWYLAYALFICIAGAAFTGMVLEAINTAKKIKQEFTKNKEEK